MRRCSQRSEKDQWKTTYGVKQYMYCHPDTVTVRRGLQKTLRWQHLVGVYDLFISVDPCAPNDLAVNSVGLHYRHHTFEQLHPLSRLIARHHLVVSWFDTWIGLKWTTLKGNTQFQVQLTSSEDAQHLLRRLQHSGCSIEHKQIISLDARSAFDAVNEDADATLSNDLCRTKDWDSALQSSQANRPVSQTPSVTFCDRSNYADSLYSLFSTQAESHTQTSLHGPGASRSSVRRKPSACLLPLDSSFLHSTVHTDISMDETVSVPIVVKHTKLTSKKRSLQLKVESYAYADIVRTTNGWKQGSKWFHVGLVSSLFLSLVNPCSAAEKPLALLTRGSDVLAEFTPHPDHLRAYYGEGILGLRQKTGFSDSSGHVQLHMKPVRVETVCRWLAYWGVRVESPDDPVLPTESTHFNSGWGVRPSSLGSFTSDIRPSSRMSGYNPRPSQQPPSLR